MTVMTPTHTKLIERIRNLPEDIARQVADFTLFVMAQYDIADEQTADNHHIDGIEGLDERFAKHSGELEGVITTDELMAITRGE